MRVCVCLQNIDELLEGVLMKHFRETYEEKREQRVAESLRKSRYKCVCVCVCMCTCACVCMHVYEFVFKYMYVC